MLVHLGVRDLAVVDNLELDLGAGMTVLTGETGAGKSLLVDALKLAVGERANTGLVRTGAASAEVHAVFEPLVAVREWLVEHGLDDDGSCILRRVVSADGRSRAWINARPVPVSQLKALGDQLVDVHGQHAHQSLLDSATARVLLDAFGDHAQALADLREQHQQLESLRKTIDALADGGGDVEARLDYLRFQLRELESQPLDPKMIQAMDEEHRRLSHGTDLLAAVARVRDLLDGGADGAQGRIAAAARELETAVRLDATLTEPRGLLADSATLLVEIDQGLRRYGDRLDLDATRLAELEAALGTLHDLARKHRCSPGELAARAQALTVQVDALASSANRLDEALEQRKQATARYREHALVVSAARTGAARRLEGEVNAVLATLGMEGASIHFALTHRPDAAVGAHGLDAIVLEAVTNPQQPAQPLARIASGGELSRIALAIHAATVAGSPAATLVFDEVDAGVGGAVAEIVGRRMRALGDRCQVLAVTHMPQVAAVAHHQVQVHKRSDPTGTHTVAQVLDHEQRVEELARMLGGVKISAQTRAHAEEMLRASQAPPTRRARQRRPAA